MYYSYNYVIYYDTSVCRLRVPPGCSTELNHAGYMFLVTLFNRHDKDCDGALRPAEMVNLFYTCPAVPWGPEVYTTVHTNKAVGTIL